MALHGAEARLCSLGALALVAGVLYYAGARGSDPLAPRLGEWGGSLPSFLHGGAFALLALAVTRPWPRLAPWVCAGWLAIESGFELLQADAVARTVEGALSAPPWLRAYLHGTFDAFDIVGAAAGILLACLIATRTSAARGDER